MIPLVLLLGCSRPGPAPLVMLVSFDTTRADSLSCYGGEGAATPHLDALAAAGTRFAWALSHAPTTVSAHASLFSGLDPHGHGVPRNGVPLSEDIPLLAERFQAAGWDTLAVVGSSILDASMGLDRGFRVYDDDLDDTAVRRRFEDSAPSVTARALKAVDGRREDRPVFLFVHYYDAHMPWRSAPPELQSRFLQPDYQGPVAPESRSVAGLIRQGRKGPISERDRRQARGYHLAEVSWADQGFGALMQGLGERGMLADSLVVMTADHGESLGDPGSLTVLGHGIDVDLAEVHVPLLVAGRGRWATPPGNVVQRPVRLVDVGTTLLSLAGLDSALGGGEDLGPAIRGEPMGPAPPSFAEANKPFQFAATSGWHNLTLERSVAKDGYFLVRTPWHGDGPTLSLLASGQPAVDDPAREADLVAALEAWDLAAPGRASVTVLDEVRDALGALGYLDEEEAP